jgi:hypothetical protein
VAQVFRWGYCNSATPFRHKTCQTFGQSRYKRQNCNRPCSACLCGVFCFFWLLCAESTLNSRFLSHRMGSIILVCLARLRIRRSCLATSRPYRGLANIFLRLHAGVWLDTSPKTQTPPDSPSLCNQRTGKNFPVYHFAQVALSSRHVMLNFPLTISIFGQNIPALSNNGNAPGLNTTAPTAVIDDTLVLSDVILFSDGSYAC